MTTQATATLEDRLALFVREALPYRDLVVSVSRADVRRLARVIEAINRDTPDDPLDALNDVDLAVVVMSCALTGLEAGEDADGVWADVDGHTYDLPRRVRASRWRRLRYALRAARTTWRAS